MSFLCLLVLFLLSSSSINALNIHTTNSSTLTLALPSQYTTIGTYPTTSQFYNITVVKSEDVHSHTFQPSKSSAGTLQYHIVVFVGDIPDTPASLAVDVEKYGALALVFKQQDHFRGGRAVAFKTPVSIPVVVVSSSVLDELVNNVNDIKSVELTPISSSERSLIRRMQHEISALIILVTIIYVFLTPFFIYLFIFEVIYVYRIKQRYFSHNCLMKLVAVFTSIAWLLWITVDPMGFKVKAHWDATAVCFLSGGLLLALYLLVLRSLVLILSSTHFSSWHKTFISRMITLYGLAIFFLVLCILFGTAWNNPTTTSIFVFFLCTSVLVVGILFAIVGKLMIATLTGSGNRSKKANTIIARLSGFIAYYGVASIILLGTVHGHFSNNVYTTFTCALLHSVGLIVTFLLLFLRFPSQMHKTRHHRSSSVTRTPSKSRLPSADSFSDSSNSPTTEGLSNSESMESPRELSRLNSSSGFDSDTPLHTAK